MVKGMRKEWGTNMVVNKSKFMEHYGVLHHKELMENLPEKATVTQMLHYSGLIINKLNTSLISQIHQNLNKKEREENDG